MNRINFGPSPDTNYIVRGFFQQSAQVLAANSDTPEMPTRFHQLIVYEAMRKYAAEAGAPDLWAHAKDEAARMWGALRADQLPQGRFGSPVA